MNFETRQLEEEDYYKGFLNLLQQLTDINPDNITFEKFKDYYNLIKNKIFVIEKDNKIIATGSILIEHKFIHDLSQIGHIEDVVVSSDYRGFGLGKLIIKKLVDYCEKEKCYKVILDCAENNVKFYEKCGFENKGIQMSYYFIQNN